MGNVNEIIGGSGKNPVLGDYEWEYADVETVEGELIARKKTVIADFASNEFVFASGVGAKIICRYWKSDLTVLFWHQEISFLCAAKKSSKAILTAGP